MATIRDVAKLSGVSTATVSNVLNARSTKVSTDTRRRVLHAVRSLHYKPTPLEQSQGAILTQNLALVCGDLSTSPLQSNHYFGRVFDGILEAAALQKWSVTVFVERMWSDTGDAVRRSYDGRCDGVIAIAPFRDCALVPNLVERGVPIVSVGTTPELAGVSSVDIDNEAAAADLTRYLVRLGHSRIAFFGPDWNVSSSFERAAGFRNAISESGLCACGRLLLIASSPRSRIGSLGHPSIELETLHVAGTVDDLVGSSFSDSSEAPTAILCWNEDFAAQAISALRRRGLRVPADVSVVGFDGAEAAVDSELQLTTARQPFREIGRRAVDMLISRIFDPDLPDENVRFKADLVVRGSTGPPPSEEMPRARHSHSNSIAVITNGGRS